MHIVVIHILILIHSFLSKKILSEAGLENSQSFVQLLVNWLSLDSLIRMSTINLMLFNIIDWRGFLWVELLHLIKACFVEEFHRNIQILDHPFLLTLSLEIFVHL